MENWLTAPLPELIKVLGSVVIIFIITIIYVRIAGLRTFAKMSSIDFASTIAIGSVLASVVLSSDTSIVKGIVALGGIIGFQFLFSYAIRKTEILQKLFTNKPLLLMKNGEILHENLQKTNLRKEDLVAKLREANVIKLTEVLAVVLENTGDVSVLHDNNNNELDALLLEGVRRT